jgi:lathosterol oxidase
MSDRDTKQDQKTAPKLSGWNWLPDEPVKLTPAFDMPPKPAALLVWLVASWHVMTTRVMVLLLAIASWYWLQPALERCKSFEFGWIAEIYARNMIFMLVVAGGLHLYFITFRKQDKERKFDPREMAKDNGSFLFRNQVWDNMFWTLASGVSVWTGFEVLMFWGWANGYAPMLLWNDNPYWFIGLFFLQPIWGSFHFYWIHRLLHWPPFYRIAHALHHKNINVGPWSGMSMHPIEHILYLSTTMIHFLVLSHPIHFLFHMQFKALEAVTSHAGFESLLVKDKKKLAVGDFFHQMHHRYFECNYGTLEMPWDRWFGSFHDGTAQANNKIRERRQRIFGEEK